MNVSRSGRILLAAGVVIGWALLLLGTGASSQAGDAPKPPASTPQSIAEGKVVFFDYCSGCHGRRADGRGPQSLNLIPRPQNLRNAQFVKYLTDERIYTSISGGVRGTGMPAWELMITPEKRWSVIHYIRSLTADDQIKLPNGLAHQAVDPAVTNPVAPTPASLEVGRKAFLNYCASCHGQNADGKGKLANSLSPMPRNLVSVVSYGEKPFIDYMPDSRLYDSVTNGVPGTSMQPWISVLTDQERWSAITYLRDLARRERVKGESQ
jgi:mono/diheme cytochrome c family protein